MDSVFAAVFVQGSKERTVGVAVLKPRLRKNKSDVKTQTLQLYQFVDGERFASLESILVRHAPEHVFISDCGPADNLKIKTLVGDGTAGDSAASDTSTNTEIISKAKFDDKEVSPALTKLAGAVDATRADGDEWKAARKAAACLISKGSLATREDAAGTLELVLSRHDGFMRLDAAALGALNLFPAPGQGAAAAVAASSAASAGAVMVADEDAMASSSSSSASTKGPGASMAAASSFSRSVTSVHALLSHGCKTKGGRRVLRTWLLQPLVDIDSIKLRQSLVSAFHSSPVLRRSWSESMNLPDLDALASRVSRKAASLMDLLRLYQFALTLDGLVTRLQTYDADEETGEGEGASSSGSRAHGDLLRATYVSDLQGFSSELRLYCKMVEDVVEDVGAREPRIKSSWNAELAALAEERKSLEGQINRLVEEAKQAGSWASSLGSDLKFEKDKVRGHIFRTKKANEKAVRAIPIAIITHVLKDGIYFTTSGSGGLRKLSERLMEVEASYSAQSKEVLLHAVEVAQSYVPVLEGASTLISELDAYYSMAHLAASAPGSYVPPTLLPAGTGDIEIYEGRHPVMEMQEGVNFIPNDYIMKRKESRFQIISGPNMGGKSTYIRTLGVIAVMAQMGSFVPAQAATMPVFDCICARIGAGDKAVRGISTFMAEMLEASSILATATEASLVCIDELGRGTSTYDGFGLAWSISEHLAAKTKCMTLFATHFHELTSLEKTQPGVSNRHVTAVTQGDEGIVFMYSVREGPCSASFGIHVAEIAAFPPSVVAVARGKAKQLEDSAGSASAYMMGGGADGAGAGAGATGGSAGPLQRAKRTAAVLADTADNEDDDGEALLEGEGAAELSDAAKQALRTKRRKVHEELGLETQDAAAAAAAEGGAAL